MRQFPTSLPARANLKFRDGEAAIEFLAGQPDFERFPETAAAEVPVIDISVTMAGRPVAHGSFYMWRGEGGSFEDIWVEPSSRRRGVATALYDFMESLGLSVEPSAELDEDGSLFWESRLESRTATPA